MCVDDDRILTYFLSSFWTMISDHVTKGTAEFCFYAYLFSPFVSVMKVYVFF